MANVEKTINPKVSEERARKSDSFTIFAMGVLWMIVFAYGFYAKTI